MKRLREVHAEIVREQMPHRNGVLPLHLSRERWRGLSGAASSERGTLNDALNSWERS
jgi:hypothetical protein